MHFKEALSRCARQTADNAVLHAPSSYEERNSALITAASEKCMGPALRVQEVKLLSNSLHSEKEKYQP